MSYLNRPYFDFVCFLFGSGNAVKTKGLTSRRSLGAWFCSLQPQVVHCTKNSEEQLYSSLYGMRWPPFLWCMGPCVVPAVPQTQLPLSGL